MKNLLVAPPTDEVNDVNKVMRELFPDTPFVLIYSADNSQTGIVSNVPDVELVAALQVVILLLEESDADKPVQH